MKFKKLMILFIFFGINNKQHAADDFGFSEGYVPDSKTIIYGSLGAVAATMVTLYFLKKNDVITWAWLDWVNKDGAEIKKLEASLAEFKKNNSFVSQDDFTKSQGYLAKLTNIVDGNTKNIKEFQDIFINDKGEVINWNNNVEKTFGPYAKKVVENRKLLAVNPQATAPANTPAPANTQAPADTPAPNTPAPK